MNNRIEPIPMMLHIIGNIPTSYAMAMSYEEQLLCLKNYLCEKVVPTMNKNIEEIQTLITYINNYFDNLDLQEEVNNKIEEMYEGGQLQEIITQYLQVSGVLSFNTLNDMINATNIIDGSTCRTLGLNTFNDGKGELYKIREITNEDVVDGVNIIAIPSSETLIAERIFTYNEKFDEYVKVNNLSEFLRLIQIPNTGIEICKEITLNESITPANNIKIKNGIINYSGNDEFVIDLTNKNLIIDNVTFNIEYTETPSTYSNGFIKTNNSQLKIENCTFNLEYLTFLYANNNNSKIYVNNNTFNCVNTSQYNYVLFSKERTDLNVITTPSNIIMFIENKLNNFGSALLLDCDSSIISNNIFTNCSNAIACFKVKDTTISNNTITGFVSNGICLGNGTDDLIENVVCSNNALDGKDLSTNTQTSLVHGINLYKQGGDDDLTGETHPNIGKSKYVTICNNSIKNCHDSGIFAYVNGNVIISNNICTNNSAGILEGGPLSTNIGNLIINNNYTCDNSGMGIGIGGASNTLSNVTCSGNISNNNQRGLYLGGITDNIIISNNIFNNNSNVGLDVNGSRSCQIVNNCVKNNTNGQISLSLRSNEVEVIGNDVSINNAIVFVGNNRPKIIKNNIGLTNNIDLVQDTFIKESNNNTISCSIPVTLPTAWLIELFRITVISSRHANGTQQNIKQKVIGYSCYNGSAVNQLVNEDIFKSDETTYNITINSSYNTTTNSFDFTATCSNSAMNKTRIIIERLDGTNISNNITS